MTDESADEIADLVAYVAEQADAVDRSGQLAAQTIPRLHSAGVLDPLRPAVPSGGPDLAGFFDSVRRLSGACGSTGWLVAQYGLHRWHLGMFDRRAQDQVWDGGPDVLVTASHGAGGRAEPAGDRYLLSGRWTFCYGVEHAGWILLTAPLTDGAGHPLDLVTFLVPTGDLRIDRNWDVTGLRAAGGHDVVLDQVAVPAHRCLSVGDAINGSGPGNSGALFRVPLPTMAALAATVPMVGIAEQVYRSFVGWYRMALDRPSPGLRQNIGEQLSTRVGLASGRLDAATLSSRSAVRLLAEHVHADTEIDISTRIRIRRDQQIAAEDLVDLVESLFRHTSGEVLRVGNPVERGWRDIHAARTEPLHSESVQAIVGAAAIGLAPPLPMI